VLSTVFSLELLLLKLKHIPNSNAGPSFAAVQIVFLSGNSGQIPWACPFTGDIDGGTESLEVGSVDSGNLKAW
jgi:hypothetical protein